MKYVAWDYEETYYMIFPHLGDDILPGPIEFYVPQSPENDEIISNLTENIDEAIGILKSK